MDELLEARKLIAAHEKELEALTARLAIEQERYRILQQKANAEQERAEALAKSIQAERDGTSALKDAMERKQKELAKIQKRYGLLKKLMGGAFILGFLMGR